MQNKPIGELKEKAEPCKWGCDASGLFGVSIHSLVNGVGSCWRSMAARGLARRCARAPGWAPAGPHGARRQKGSTVPLGGFRLKRASFVPFPEAPQSHGPRLHAALGPGRPGRAAARRGGEGDGCRWGRDNGGIQQTGGNAARASLGEALNRPGCA